MSLPKTMRAMVTMGHGDLDQMVLHEDWPRPEPGPGEVLIKVGAAAVKIPSSRAMYSISLHNIGGYGGVKMVTAGPSSPLIPGAGSAPGSFPHSASRIAASSAGPGGASKKCGPYHSPGTSGCTRSRRPSHRR